MPNTQDNYISPRADLIASRLENVKFSKNGFRADCPNGHKHAKRSLSVTEDSEGRVLMHCFSCGDTPAILRAIGLSLTDLYPEPIKDNSPTGRKALREAHQRNSWASALRVLEFETRVVVIAGQMILNHEALTSDDARRVRLALTRIDRAREVLAP